MYDIDQEFPGLTYDTALPQKWVNAVQKRGLDPRGHVVWAYPKGNLFGNPMPRDAEGTEILGKLAMKIA